MAENVNPDVAIVLRTPLAIIPPSGKDTDRREISKCLIVPGKHEVFACVTDTMCIAVVRVEGEASRESAVDLAMIDQASIRLPTVVRKTDIATELFHAVKPFDEWKPIGHRFCVKDDSDAAKFPNTAGILEPIADPEKYQIVRVNADLLCKLAEAITDGHETPRVSLLIPKDGEVDDIRVVRGSDIGIVRCIDSEGQATRDEVVARFNNTANAFNAARAEAKRKGGA